MLQEKSKKLIKKLGKKYGIKLIMLFGSALKDKKLRFKNDIDLAILADKEFYENDYSKFRFELLDVADLEKREIDTVPISSQNPLLLYDIFQEGEPIYYRSEEEYAKIRSWARWSYEDNSRFFDGREELLQKRIKKLEKALAK